MLRQVQLVHNPAQRRILTRAGLLAAIFVIAGTLAVLPFPIDTVLLIAPVAGLVMLTHPVLLIFGLIASVPVQDAIPVPEGIPITATRAMTAATLILLPLVLVRRSYGAQWSRLLLAIAAVIVVMILSLWNATEPAAGYAELYHWFLAGVAFWLTITFVRTRKMVLVALGLIAGLALAQGTIGAVQALLGMGPASFQIATGFSRAYGSFGMPNSYAAYLESVTLPLIPVLIWAMSRLWRDLKTYSEERFSGYLTSSNQRRQLLRSFGFALLILTGTTAGLTGLALSFSRGGWLGVVAALVVIVVLLGRRAIITSAAAILIVTFGLMIGASGTVLEIIEERSEQLIQQAQIGDIRAIPVTDDNFATVERMSHWQTAIAMWDTHPWLGVGAGNYNERFEEFAVHPQFRESQGHAHNYYLHTLAETGLIGLGAYLMLIIATLVIGWRAYRSPDPLASAIGIGAIGLTTALVVHNMFENLHVLNISLQMMFVWALALTASRTFGENLAGSANDSNFSGRLLYDSPSDDRTRSGLKKPSLPAREFR